MKRLSYILLMIVAVFSAQAAGNADAIINQVVNTYRAAKGISADYIITTDQGQTSGNIAMKGEKFRMLSADLKCWYNGTLQWSYTPVTEEVNITQPTAEELQMVNPYSIISSFRQSFSTQLLKSATASNHEVQMLPKNSKSTDIKSVRLTINKTTNLPVKIIFELKDMSSVIVTLSHYKTGQNFSDNTFVFNKTMVPAGTPVVDLR